MVKVKICGLTNLEDAQVAIEAGADLLGFIFYEPSPRYVHPETVREIISNLRDKHSNNSTTHHALRTTSSPLFVGVFVNTPQAEVSQIVDFCGLDAVQLSGAEAPQFVTHFQGRAFKVLQPQSAVEAGELVQKYQPAILAAESPQLPAFLLEAYHPTLYGGTGQVTDWTMAATLARQYPIMLAGSLTPSNVAEAIDTVQPWGVDVSSGVEAEKGRKDHRKVWEFIERAKIKSNE
jgi:phosphoribosylanthranilate isomerase